MSGGRLTSVEGNQSVSRARSLVFEGAGSDSEVGALYLWVLYLFVELSIPIQVQDPSWAALRKPLWALCGLVLIIRSAPRIRQAMTGLRWTPAVLVFAMASALWSSNWLATLQQATILWIAVLAAFGVGSHVSIEELEKIVGRLLVFVAVASPFAALIAPEYATYPGVRGTTNWTGLTASSNGLGFVSVLAIVYLLRSNRRWSMVLLGGVVSLVGLAMVSLYYSNARTAQLALPVAIFIGLNTNMVLAKRLLRLALLGIAGGGLVLVSANTSGFASSGFARLGKDVTLTGRTEIWALQLKRFVEVPLVGDGYGAFWNSSGGRLSYETAGGWIRTVSHGHSTLITILLYFGIIGSVLVGFSIRELVQRPDGARRARPAGSRVSLAIVPFLLFSVLDTMAFNESNFFLFFLLTVLVSRRGVR